MRATGQLTSATLDSVNRNWHTYWGQVTLINRSLTSTAKHFVAPSDDTLQTYNDHVQ